MANEVTSCRTGKMETNQSWRPIQNAIGRAICICLASAAVSLSGGCATDQSVAVGELSKLEPLDRAIVLARLDFKQRFPKEYEISVWDVVTADEGNSWYVLFAHPIPAELGAVPRSGRLFEVSKSDFHILNSAIM